MLGQQRENSKDQILEQIKGIMEDSSKRNQQSQLEQYFLKILGSKETQEEKEQLRNKIFEMKFENVNLINEKKNLEFQIQTLQEKVKENQNFFDKHV